MKIILKPILILLLSLTIVLSTKTNNNAALKFQQTPSLGSALINKYKDLKNPFGNHSLFSGHNGTNVSKFFKAVPPPIPDK